MLHLLIQPKKTGGVAGVIDVSLSGVLECQSGGPAAGEENWGEISGISRCISFVSRYISHISLYPAHIPLYPVVDIVKNLVQSGGIEHE